MEKSNKCHLIIAGAQKSGTTWLHNTLEYQDEFWCPKDRQEVHFFDRFYDRGYKYYEGKYEKSGKRKITFDTTPAYLCHPLVPERISKYKKVCPRKIKVIALLRNPIERSISAYKMKVKSGGYKLKLSEAISVDTTILEKSKYSEALKRYKNTFGESFKIFITEKMFQSSSKTLNKIANFSGAKENIKNIYKDTKVNSSSKGKTPTIVRVGGKVLRYVGAEKVIHEVKKRKWSKIFRKWVDNGFEPVVDRRGVKLLKNKLKDEVKRVDKLVDHHDVKSIWGLD